MNTNMDRYNRYPIFTGVRSDRKLLHPKMCGEAYEVPDELKPHYVVKIWALSRETYYLSKNRDNENYTLFSKKVESEDGFYRFQNPIGYGVILKDLTTHLEVLFTFPRQLVYMSLFPNHEKDQPLSA